MTEYRWPARECYHENVGPGRTVVGYRGEKVLDVPGRCSDCGWLDGEGEEEDYENPIGEIPDLPIEGGDEE